MMKKKIIGIIILMNLTALVLGGCWNYREIESLAIATGFAVDKEGDKFVVNIEIASAAGEKGESKVESVVLKSEGITIFDAVREIIAKTGMKVFWSHLKVIILGQGVFNKDIADTLDWVVRDAETREDAWVLASQEKDAASILLSKAKTESLVAFQLEETLRAQKAIARFPSTPIWKYLEEMTGGTNISVLPAVRVIEETGKKIPIIEGAAVIKKDELKGWLSAEEVKALLWVRNELNGGLYIAENVAGSRTHVSLEIFGSKTKLKPVIKDNKLIMEINITTSVEVAEIGGWTDYVSESGLKKLRSHTEQQIKEDILKLVYKAQNELNSDIFGFGSVIKRKMPSLWRELEPDWDEYFAELPVEIKINLKIRGSATIRKPIRISD